MWVIFHGWRPLFIVGWSAVVGINIFCELQYEARRDDTGKKFVEIIKNLNLNSNVVYRFRVMCGRAR